MSSSESRRQEVTEQMLYLLLVFLLPYRIYREIKLCICCGRLPDSQSPSTSVFNPWLATKSHYVQRLTVCADEAGLLQLSELTTSQVVWRGTAREQAQRGVKSEPLGQPRQTTVAVQRVVRYTPINTHIHIVRYTSINRNTRSMTSRDYVTWQRRITPSDTLNNWHAWHDRCEQLNLSFTVISPIIARKRPRTCDWRNPAVTSRCDVIAGTPGVSTYMILSRCMPAKMLCVSVVRLFLLRVLHTLQHQHYLMHLIRHYY